MDWSSFSLGNAAGFIKGPGSQFNDMLRSAATDITIGSITCGPRHGNLGKTYHLEGDGTTVNALGLPNPGLKQTLEDAPGMAKAAADAGKRLRWSVAGFSPSETQLLTRELCPFGHVEINLGCPNVWDSSGQKPIASFDLNLLRMISEQVFVGVRDADVSYKVSPHSNPDMIVRSAELFKRFPIRSVIACNTFPNGIAIKDGGRAIDTKNGYGGVAGNALHTIMLGQVAQWVEALEGSDIDVYGVGGISSGERLAGTQKVGAAGAQIGTAFGERGGRVFSEYLEEISSAGE